MRHIAQHADRNGQSTGGTGFVVGTVLCAAIMAALFTLHGAPDLLAGKLPALTQFDVQSP
jgi:hypothetical protein